MSLAKRVAIKQKLAGRYKIAIRVRCKVWVFPTSKTTQLPRVAQGRLSAGVGFSTDWDSLMRFGVRWATTLVVALGFAVPSII
jgi:hypothetical protein